MKNKHVIIFLILLFLLILFLVIAGIIGYKKEAEISRSSEIERLKSLPYLSWVPIDEKDKLKSGVTKYNSELAYKGVNLYSSRPMNKAYLTAMDGKLLHTWFSDTTDGWHHIRLASDGNLFFIEKNRLLRKLDLDSNVIWTNRAQFHHVIEIAENGDIYSITRDNIPILYHDKLIPVIDDHITIISPGGKINSKLSIFKLFGEQIPKARLNKIYEIMLTKKKGDIKITFDTIFDVFHTNWVEIIDRDIKGLCKKGDILISVRELDTIAIIDIKKEKVIWSWGKNKLSRQHNPTLLENGNILIFDNGTFKRDHSRIVELNPITKEIEWEFRANPPYSFYSQSRGGAQKLPNGNILITESDKGHVFEILKNGDIVWEFYNPDIIYDPDIEGNVRAAIYRMVRLDPETLKNITDTIKIK